MKVRNFCILYAEYYLMPDNISANGRNFLARDGVKGRRIIYRQMDETYESVLDAQREAMMKPRSVE